MTLPQDGCHVVGVCQDGGRTGHHVSSVGDKEQLGGHGPLALKKRG